MSLLQVLFCELILNDVIYRIGGDLYEKDILVALKKFISKYPKVESLE